MNLSQKCQYALRAVFELATRYGQGPVTVGDIADKQAIPPRFLELILVQLKQAGYIESRRGVQGGYSLSLAPTNLTVGDVIRTIEGPLAPVKKSDDHPSRQPLKGDLAFSNLWTRAEKAVAGVYDKTSFQDLIDEERAATSKYSMDFTI
jgi:Rrf2 family transcriptional regulator, cysteine metabolism repressor